MIDKAVFPTESTPSVINNDFTSDNFSIWEKTFNKDINIRAITSIPRKYRKQMK